MIESHTKPLEDNGICSRYYNTSIQWNKPKKQKANKYQQQQQQQQQQTQTNKQKDRKTELNI